MEAINMHRYYAIGEKENMQQGLVHGTQVLDL